MGDIRVWLAGAAAAACLTAVSAPPAGAVTAKECSVKYKQAKADGTLGGMKWKDFRAKQCTSVEPVAATPGTSAVTAKAPAVTHTAAAPGASGSAAFPTVVDPKYSKETAGKARMHTCLDQYHANKASNANGGLRWIQKGGGYYSACTKKLKG